MRFNESRLHLNAIACNEAADNVEWELHQRLGYVERHYYKGMLGEELNGSHLLGAVKAVPDNCSAYRPYGHTCVIFWMNAWTDLGNINLFDCLELDISKTDRSLHLNWRFMSNCTVLDQLKTISMAIWLQHILSVCWDLSLHTFRSDCLSLTISFDSGTLLSPSARRRVPLERRTSGQTTWLWDPVLISQMSNLKRYSISVAY